MSSRSGTTNPTRHNTEPIGRTSRVRIPGVSHNVRTRTDPRPANPGHNRRLCQRREARRDRRRFEGNKDTMDTYQARRAMSVTDVTVRWGWRRVASPRCTGPFGESLRKTLHRSSRTRFVFRGTAFADEVANGQADS